jgi:murein tripeptide amidase MpaA
MSPMAVSLRVSVLIFLLCRATLAEGPVRVTDAFESGNLGVWHVEGDTHLILVPRTEYDHDHINSAVTWFYGRLSNVLHREVTIQIEGLDYTVYNGQKGNILPFERNTVPVFSYDGAVWERFTDCSFRKEARTFRIRHVFSRDIVWIAYIPPYTLSKLESLLSELRPHPGVRIETIGKSVEGRPLYLVSVAEPGSSEEDRPVTWIVARQHAFEAGGSWAVEGLLRFLTGPDPEAQSIRKQVLFKVCPMVNPDGVVVGGTRFNARGIDLNRHWHTTDPLSQDVKSAPEIALLKRAILAWRANHRLDLWINIHNNDMVWNEDGDYIRFAPAGREADVRRLEALLRQETIFTGPFEPAADSMATEAVVAAETGAVGLLMEMKTGYLKEQDRWTGVDLFLAHGSGLARTAFRFFRKQE